MSDAASPAPTPAAASPAAPPARKGKVIPTLAFLAVVGVLCGYWVRGSIVSEPRDPKSSSEGYVRQVVLAPDGTKQVRCSVVLDYPAEKVWAVVTDYPHFADFLPHLKPFTDEREADGRHHVRGSVTSWFVEWPVDVVVKHEEDAAAGRFASSWDSPGGALTRNRGGWTITRRDAQSCLCVYAIDVAVAHGPEPLVRNVLLHKVRTGLAALQKELARRAKT